MMQLKRILVSLLVAIMILSTGIVAVSAADESFDVAVEATSAADGKTVEVNVVIKNNPGVSKFQIDIEYNSEFLTPVTGEDGALVVEKSEDYSFKNTVLSEADGVKIVAPGKIMILSDPNNEADITATGSIVKLSFTISEKANCSATIEATKILAYSGLITKVDATVEGSFALASHELKEEVVTASTCEVAGTANVVCSVCGYTETKELPLADHTAQVIPGTAATCLAEGTSDAQVCSVCGITLVESVKTDKAAHTEEVIPAVEPTYSEAGSTEGVKCSVCGEILVQPDVVPAKSLTWLWIVIAAVVVVGAAAVVVFVVAKKKK